MLKVIVASNYSDLLGNVAMDLHLMVVLDTVVDLDHSEVTCRAGLGAVQSIFRCLTWYHIPVNACPY